MVAIAVSSDSIPQNDSPDSGEMKNDRAHNGSDPPYCAAEWMTNDAPLLRVHISRADGALLIGDAEAACATFARSDGEKGGWNQAPPPPALGPLRTTSAVEVDLELTNPMGRDVDDEAGHENLRAGRTFDAFENQRRLTMFRPYSASDLFALDWAPFSDELGRKRYSSLVEVPPPPGWEWASEWRVDLAGENKSEEGWQYGIHFNTGWLAASNPLTHVRRRRWLRRAVHVYASKKSSMRQSAISPAAINSAIEVPNPIPITSNIAYFKDSDAAAEYREGSTESRDVASPSDLAGGLFQLSVADGARLRLSAEGVDVSGELDRIAKRLAESLGGVEGEWYVNPLALALHRFRRYISSPTLQIQVALEVSSVSNGEPGTFAINLHGTATQKKTGDFALKPVDPGEGVELTDLLQTCRDAGPAAADYVLLVRNTVNMIDFVSDMHDIYRALTENAFNT